MNTDFSSLRDPQSGARLTRQGDELVCDGQSYPVVDEIPRFVPMQSYADDFGDQWNRFPKTQLDSYSGVDLTESRLRRCFRGNLAQIEGKRVLEAGSGAGRFTEIFLKYGAQLHSFDMSKAVNANSSNNSASDNLTLVQASIYDIPFEPAAYDYVMCLGVIQHTPSPEESIRHLWAMVKPGGHLVIDHYIFRWRSILPPPIWRRRQTLSLALASNASGAAIRSSKKNCGLLVPPPLEIQGFKVDPANSPEIVSCSFLLPGTGSARRGSVLPVGTARHPRWDHGLLQASSLRKENSEIPEGTGG